MKNNINNSKIGLSLALFAITNIFFFTIGDTCCIYAFVKNKDLFFRSRELDG